MASPFDRFQTYMRAFKMGAGASAFPSWRNRTHADVQIREAWDAGLARGLESRIDAVRTATAMTGHTPYELRIAEEEDA